MILKQVATENITIKGARILVPTAKEAFSQAPSPVIKQLSESN